MIYAYLFHGINIAVAITLVPLLLRYLNNSEYTIWLIFGAFGGFTIHIQNAIQNASVKEIARGVHLNDGLERALQRMRTAYAGLTLFIALPFLAFGLLYFKMIGESRYNLEWIIFVVNYVLLYTFAPNYSVLLGTGRVNVANSINAFTRALYLLAVLTFLYFKLSILGLCLAFLLSTIVSVILSTIATRAHKHPAWNWSLSPNLAPYAAFAFLAFALYNGSLLVAATQFPPETIASYGLGIQAGMLLFTLCLAPLQVWLARLVKAIGKGNAKREFLHNLIMINILFALGAIALLVFGQQLLSLIGSRIQFPPLLALILFAIAVEANIAVPVNFLMALGQYRFVRVYVPIALLGIAIGAGMAQLTSNIQWYILGPVGLQLFISLPWIINLALMESRRTATPVEDGEI